MRIYGPDLIHNVGLFGHGGSGKTTLAEAMLLVSKGISRMGSVADGTTVSDFDPEEKSRHMSINLTIEPVEWQGNKINVIDVPGYSEFSGEVAAAMRVLDGAVIVLDSAGGVEVGTEQVWEQAVKASVPRIIFINKLDRENADFYRCIDQARKTLDAGVIPMQLPIGQAKEFRGIVSLRRQRAWMVSEKHDGTFTEAPVPADMAGVMQEWREQLIDRIAATNDNLIEKYLEQGAEAFTLDEIREGLRAGIASGSIVPVFIGSAFALSGITQLLDGIVDSFPSSARRPVPITEGIAGKPGTLRPAPDEALSALVFKTLVDPYGKISYVRVFSGTLSSNSSVYNVRTGKDERIGQLYTVRGKEQIPVQSIPAGDIGAITKLADTHTDDTLCARERIVDLRHIQFPAPAFQAMVRPHSKADTDRLGVALAQVLEEDPTLHTDRDPQTGETLLSGMGESHLQIIADRMRRKFNVDVDLELPHIPYRETIRGRTESQYRHKKQTGGRGQFADVSLRIEPLAADPSRTDPLEFVNEIVGGVISRGYIPAVEKGVREAMAEGVLSGNPVLDVRVTVFDGKMHEVDSSEMAFKLASSQAFKQGVLKAQPVIMEPIYELRVTVPEAYAGDVMSDFNTRRGRVMGIAPEDGGKVTVTAHVPLAECQRYATDLRSITQGRGRFTMQFDHYEDVPPHVSQALQAEHQKRLNHE